jgi:YD repeat-containing protein
LSSKAATFTNSYDTLNRLTNAAYSDGSSESYSYDPAGNRLSRTIQAATIKSDATPPSTPANLAQIAFTTNQLSLRWNRAFDTGGSGLAGYQVYVNGQLTATTTDTNFIMSGLMPDTEYCVTVAAIDRDGNLSPQSDSLCFTTTASIATAISWYFYPTSLPNSDSTTEFPIARDILLNGICLGGPLSTHSRVGNPTGIEIRQVFDASDMTVATNNYLWRGNFNPPAPYATQHGQRVYCPVLLIGQNGKVSLDRLQYQVTCGVTVFNNQSSLTGLPYSVSRIGIQAGADGVLFTPDDILITSGSGTNLVDAIAFIGARIGALINQPAGLDALNSAIGPSGVFMTFNYEFAAPTGPLNGNTTLWLYPQNLIPTAFNSIVPFIGPNGILFSIVGPANSTAMTLKSASNIAGPWAIETTSAVEGTSSFIYFNTNKQAFFQLVPNQ